MPPMKAIASVWEGDMASLEKDWWGSKKATDEDGTAEHLFFDNPLLRETREFAQARTDSNIQEISQRGAYNTPPSPTQIKDKPGGDYMGTMNRLIVHSDEDLKGVPDNWGDLDKHPKADHLASWSFIKEDNNG